VCETSVITTTPCNPTCYTVHFSYYNRKAYCCVVVGEVMQRSDDIVIKEEGRGGGELSLKVIVMVTVFQFCVMCQIEQAYRVY
jgi:hypothetical protein